MRVNFKILQNYALEFEERLIDLHNNFDFKGFTYESGNRELTIFWERSVGEWIQANELLAVSLVHKGVSYLSIIDQNTDVDEAWTCLSELTYYPSITRNENEHFLDQTLPSEGDDIIYSFESQQIIRIDCEEIELAIL